MSEQGSGDRMDSAWDGAHFPKEQQTGVLLGLGWSQVAVLGAGLGLGVVLVLIGGAPRGLLLGAGVTVVAAAVGVPKVAGRAVVEWIVLLGRYARRGAGNQLSYVQRDSTLFADAGAPAAGVLGTDVDEAETSEGDERDQKGRIVPGRGWRFRLPGESVELRAYRLPGGAGFVYDPRRGEGRFTAKILTSKGFDLESFESKEDRTGHWRDGLSAVAHLPGVVHIATSDQTTLVSGSRIQDFYQSRVETSRAQGLAAGEVVDPFLHSSFMDLMSEAQDMPVHELWLTVVLSKEKLARRIKSLGGGLPGFMEIALKFMSTIEGVLPPSGTEVAGWHSPRSIAGVSRSAFDPDSSVEISERTGSWVGAAPSSAGPMAMETKLDHTITDGWMHRVFKVSEFPQRQARLGFLDSFVFAGEFRHTVTTFYLPGDLREAKRRVQGRKSSWSSSDRMLAKLDRPPSLEHQREWDDIEQEENELVDGYAPVNIEALVVVTGRDELELEANCADLIGRAVQANCELRVLFSEQDTGFLAGALPFAWIER